MNKKMILIILLFVVLGVGAFALVTVTTMPTETETQAKEGSESATDSEDQDVSSGKEAAKALVEKTVTKEEIEEKVGKYEKFEMSSDGCERGVYAGRFYYKDFSIFSRTYDKGNTFHVVSIN